MKITWNKFKAILKRDFKLRFMMKWWSTSLTLANPILIATIFAGVFTSARNLRLGNSQINFVFVLTGYSIAWLFPGSLMNISQSILTSKEVLKSLKVHPYLFALSQTLLSILTIDVTLFSYTILVKHELSLALISILLPVTLTPLIAGFSYTISCVLFVDTNLSSSLSTLFSVLMYTSPVFYDPQNINSWILSVVRLNPASWLINWERHFLIGTPLTHYWLIEIFGLFLSGITLYLIGNYGFRKIVETI